MFAFASFTDSNPPLEVERQLRRLIETSNPRRYPSQHDCRREERSDRTLPVLLIPLESRGPVVAETIFAVTKNLSGEGAAVVIQQPFPADEAVLGVWNDGTLTFLTGNVCYRTPLEAGFLQVGLLLTGTLSADKCESLAKLARLAQHLSLENVASHKP